VLRLRDTGEMVRLTPDRGGSGGRSGVGVAEGVVSGSGLIEGDWARRGRKGIQEKMAKKRAITSFFIWIV